MNVLFNCSYGCTWEQLTFFLLTERFQIALCYNGSNMNFLSSWLWYILFVTVTDWIIQHQWFSIGQGKYRTIFKILIVCNLLIFINFFVFYNAKYSNAWQIKLLDSLCVKVFQKYTPDTALYNKTLCCQLIWLPSWNIRYTAYSEDISCPIHSYLCPVLALHD